MELIRLYANNGLVSEHPIFGNDLKITIEKDNNEMYHRTKASGTITFLKDDYLAIWSSEFNDEHKIELVLDNIVVATATFFRTDCRFDTDNKICTLEPSFVDRYELLLNGINNKENITQLGVDIDAVDCKIRTIMQLYLAGESEVTTFVGNMSFAQRCEALSDEDEIINRGHFGRLASRVGSIQFTATNNTLRFLDGVYTGEITFRNNPERPGAYIESGRLYNKNGYSIDYMFRVGSTPQPTKRFYNPDGTPLIIDGLYVEANYFTGSQTCYIFHEGGNSCYPTNTYEQPTSATFTNNGTFGDITYTAIYARLLSATNADGWGTWFPVSNDFVEGTFNYKYALPIRESSVNPADTEQPPVIKKLGLISPRIKLSHETQITPTEWGKSSNGEYFVKPTSESIDARYFPVLRSAWSPLSWWFSSNLRLANKLDETNVDFTLKDAYEITNVISTLAQKIDPSIQGVTSEFLQERYNPMIQEWGDFTKIFVTPITNIKKTNYEQATQRGDISLADLFGVLKTMGLYWKLDNNNYIRIEHYKYFYLGNSYTANEGSIMADLTSIKNPRYGKLWDFALAKESWDLYAPKRLQFAWQTKCTEEFNGYPLEVTDAYMRKGNSKDINAGNFISDIDLIIAAPNEMNDDAFAVILASYQGAYKTQVIQANLGGNKMGATPYVTMQNGYLSFLWLEQNLLNYGLGGENIRIKGIDLKAPFVAKMREQDVTFPMPFGDLSENSLIKTSLGLGAIKNLEYNISSRSVEATIRLETNDNADFVRVDPNSIYFSADEGLSEIVSISASKPLSELVFQSNVGWVTMYYNPHLVNIIVTVLENTSEEARDAEITIKCGDATTKFYVQQGGRIPQITVNPDSIINIPYEGGLYQLVFNVSNYEFFTSSAMIEDSERLDAYTLQIYIGQNPRYVPRKEDVIFTNRKTEVVLHLEQLG